MEFRIRHLDHIVLRVRDMERALAFYTGVLGCQEERRLEEIGLVQLRAGASLIDLVPDDPEPDGANMDHFALRITPFDEAGLRAWLTAHGVEVARALPRYGAEGTGPSLYIRDPDGNKVELKGPPDGLGQQS
ncbi:MAG: VOC family protein [Alphaproteobacteria bacterium]|nr:VOC family protein [Alphaproteobacteria bacterium]